MRGFSAHYLFLQDILRIRRDSMSEFKRNLSVIIAVAVLLTLCPGVGTRAEGAAGPIGVENWTGDEFYRGTENVIAFKAEFETASAADAYREKTNADPEKVIDVEIVGDPAGLSAVFFGENTAGDPYDELAENELLIWYGIAAGDDAPDSAVIRTRLLDQPDDDPYESEVQILDIPGAEKIQVAASRKVEVGKVIKIPVTVDNEEAMPFLRCEWSDEDADPAERKTDCNLWQAGKNKAYLEVYGVNPGTSTFRFMVEGSDVEAVTTVTVEPRTMTLGESEAEIDVNNQDYEIWIGDIGTEDIYHNGMAEWETSEYRDGRIEWYQNGEKPVWSISDPEIADLEPCGPEVSMGGFPEMNVKVIPKKAGTATVTVEWLGAKAEMKLTVSGIPLEDEINRMIDSFWENNPEAEMIPSGELTKMIDGVSKLLAGATLNDRIWNAMSRFSDECWAYVEAYDYELNESETTAGLLENISYFAPNMELPEQRPGEEEPWKRFWVTLGDADAADVGAVAGTGKTGFTISFAEGTDEENLTPISSLKVPVRVTLAIPEGLSAAANPAVYYVSGGKAVKLAEGAVVKKGGSLLVQIDQPGTYVMAEPCKAPSGGTSGSSSGGTSSTSSSAPAVSEGWVEDAVGWWYRYADGTWPVNAWAELSYNGRTDWYHFGADGYMQTGWFTDTDGNIYYLNPVSDGWMGSMFVGSHIIDGKTYYFNETSDSPKGALVK